MRDPIVIGALGGSGTRLIAQVLQIWGVNLGTTLNESNDELLYTHLFKRPDFIHAVSDKRLQRRLAAYAQLRMNGKISRKDRFQFMRAALDPIHGLDQSKVQEMIENYEGHTETGIWGWKEPNAHVILPHLAAVFPEMKYIHVIRHGYAMATSSNKQQLNLWGPDYGIREEAIAEDEVKAQFRFWRIANRGAQLVGEELLGDRFLLLRFEDLVEHPDETLAEVAAFLNLDLSNVDFQSGVDCVQKPVDIDRYKKVKSEDVGDDGSSLPLFGY